MAIRSSQGTFITRLDCRRGPKIDVIVTEGEVLRLDFGIKKFKFHTSQDPLDLIATGIGRI